MVSPKPSNPFHKSVQITSWGKEQMYYSSFQLGSYYNGDRGIMFTAKTNVQADV